MTRRPFATLASACIWLGAVFGLAAGAVAQTAAPASRAAASAAGACPPPARPLTQESFSAGLAAARDRGFFWRLTKDGRSSYLYGTVHAARYEWMFPGPTLQQAIRDADLLALELDILDPQIQRRLQAAIQSKDGEPLPPELAARLAQRRAAECVDEATYAAFAPEFQIASLSVLAARRDGLDPSYAIDLVLDVFARSIGKPVASLETPEIQMQALQMPTRELTLQFVSEGLAELDAGRSRPMVRRIAKIWTESDYADLERYEQWCGCVDTEIERAATRRILDERNPEIAAGIDALHASGKSVFAAVGSLHMIGPNGLPALLKARGYKVEQGSFGR